MGIQASFALWRRQNWVSPCTGDSTVESPHPGVHSLSRGRGECHRSKDRFRGGLRVLKGLVPAHCGETRGQATEVVFLRTLRFGGPSFLSGIARQRRSINACKTWTCVRSTK